MKNRLTTELYAFAGVLVFAFLFNLLLQWMFDKSFAGDVVHGVMLYLAWRIGWNLGYNECDEDRYKAGMNVGIHDLLIRTKIFFLECKRGDLYHTYLEYLYASTKREENHFEETDEVIADKLEEHCAKED